MEELTITKEAVLRAAEKCSTAKNILKEIFPEVFEADYPETRKFHESHEHKIGRAKDLMVEILNDTISGNDSDILLEKGINPFYESFCKWVNGRLTESNLPF